MLVYRRRLSNFAHEFRAINTGNNPRPCRDYAAVVSAHFWWQQWKWKAGFSYKMKIRVEWRRQDLLLLLVLQRSRNPNSAVKLLSLHVVLVYCVFVARYHLPAAASSFRARLDGELHSVQCNGLLVPQRKGFLQHIHHFLTLIPIVCRVNHIHALRNWVLRSRE